MTGDEKNKDKLSSPPTQSEGSARNTFDHLTVLQDAPSSDLPALAAKQFSAGEHLPGAGDPPTVASAKQIVEQVETSGAVIRDVSAAPSEISSKMQELPELLSQPTNQGEPL